MVAMRCVVCSIQASNVMDINQDWLASLLSLDGFNCEMNAYGPIWRITYMCDDLLMHYIANKTSRIL